MISISRTNKIIGPSLASPAASVQMERERPNVVGRVQKVRWNEQINAAYASLREQKQPVTHPLGCFPHQKVLPISPV
jgi:hypothetical protein